MYSILKVNKNKNNEIPENFKTEIEAGEFWDTHSVMDFQDYIEEVDLKHLKAAETSIVFWYSNVDDEVWNNV